ncbi:MAG: Gfo/Idh/MocA family oxidoreductase [Anaeromyxobacter sp.]|nr:Gfo/Idh/MocA family oxidoreductase [Anaeromyxobacter sp.]MBL0276876.1 Gfo/Idh/MocA family oxidoreductase [Anaeromyxobacter sp.]
MPITHPGPLRVGLLGYGLAGRTFHAPLIAAAADLVLAAVVTRDGARRARLAVEHPGALALDSVEALLERRAALGLDLVVVATPNRSHAPLARAALEVGLAVVVDKPFAASAEEGRALAGLARERGLLLGVFQNRRWDGDFLTVRRLVAEGALGEVRRLESRFERWSPAPRAGWKERPGPEEAGGLLFDLGPHLVDQALLLLGPARSVYAELDRRRPGSLVDDDDFLAIGHASGARSHLWMSKVAAQRGPRFRVVGDRAAFTLHGLDGQEQALAAGARPGAPGWGEAAPETWGLLGLEGEARPVRTERGDYPAFYAGVATALRGGGPPPAAPEQAIAGLEVLEAARVAATTGQVQRLGS